MSLRFALFYAVLFVATGIQLPYWPLWLNDRGLDASTIGILVAVQLWVKVAFNPLAGQAVDATGRRRTVLLILILGAMAGYALFPAARGFPALLALSALTGGLFAAILPVVDTLTMSHVALGRLDYGRIRLWGSLAFIAASAGTGHFLVHAAPAVIVWLIVATLAPLALCTLALPERPAVAPGGRTRMGWIDLLRSRSFLLFLAATAATGAAHAAYYGFATLHWRNAGLGMGWIGALWGTGVVAEVSLFAFSGAVVRRVGPEALILAGSLGGIVRWTLLALTTDPRILLPVQCLHALTFGATHLGAMHFLARNVAPSVSGRAQGLYAALGNGVVLGLATWMAGHLYVAIGGRTFLAMTALSVMGTLAALALIRVRRRTSPLPPARGSGGG